MLIFAIFLVLSIDLTNTVTRLTSHDLIRILTLFALPNLLLSRLNFFSLFSRQSPTVSERAT